MYKCQFCSKHFAIEDGLASHMRAKHEGDFAGSSQLKLQSPKLINKLTLFAWIFSIIQVIAILIFLFSIFLSFKMNHFYPVILYAFGASTLLVFLIAILTYIILTGQIGPKHKAQIKACTIYASFSIFTIFGIIGIGIFNGLSLIRGIIPGYAEWVSSEISAQGTHPTTTYKDIKNVKGIRPMGLSLLSYGFMSPVGFILVAILYFVYYLPRLGH